MPKQFLLDSCKYRLSFLTAIPYDLRKVSLNLHTTRATLILGGLLSNCNTTGVTMCPCENGENPTNGTHANGHTNGVNGANGLNGSEYDMASRS